MNDSALIADLIRAGVCADLVGRVANALSQSVPDLSRTVPDNREYERLRKRAWRVKKANKNGQLNTATKANDVVAVSRNVPQSVRDIAEAQPYLLTSLTDSQSGIREESKEVKKGTRNRAREASGTRGTRMSPDREMTDADWKFGRDHGVPDQEIRAMWAEFVNFWVDVPGKRGLKVRWHGTWRNRVLAIVKRRAENGATGSRRTNSAPGHAKTGADAILAGVANYAAKRGLLELANEPENGGFRRPPDIARR